MKFSLRDLILKQNQMIPQTYKSSQGYSVVYDQQILKVITKNKLDPMDWLLELPKNLILWVINQAIPSPLPIAVVTLDEEVKWYVDAFVYSPDEKKRYLTLKNLSYTLR